MQEALDMTPETIDLAPAPLVIVPELPLEALMNDQGMQVGFIRRTMRPCQFLPDHLTEEQLEARRCLEVANMDRRHIGFALCRETAIDWATRRMPKS